jgi:hypothetical protein
MYKGKGRDERGYSIHPLQCWLLLLCDIAGEVTGEERMEGRERQGSG